MPLEVGAQFLILEYLRYIFAVKKDRYPALERRIVTPNSQEIDVIPSILMERVIDHGRAEQESYLVTRHSDFDLVKIFLLNQVALRDIGSVHAAAGKRHR